VAPIIPKSVLDADEWSDVPNTTYVSYNTPSSESFNIDSVIYCFQIYE